MGFDRPLATSQSRYMLKTSGMRSRRATCSARSHILAVADIERIIQAALPLPPIASITPYTYHYLIGLLATTGMRYPKQ
jgi:hypothetical protein